MIEKTTTPIAVALAGVDEAFLEGKISNDIKVIRRAAKKWIFVFECPDPKTGEQKLYTLKTQRGKVRVWSDPRKLFEWLHERYGITKGTFIFICEECTHEKLRK
ncbi:hypothetical protein [Candidatus Burkholderia verschuerenii]|uniref:hypothetical protein n=1 Tax=Candidatus Burkholderia verschuerenii TaxID=242163 RepID=UPI00067B9895|nr:hypothetical protein [Candidatus Burkholderia verschuerenii]